MGKKVDQNKPDNSTGLALEIIQKAAAQKKATTKAMTTYCRVCFREIAPKRICGGHGEGGGSGESSSNAKEHATSSEKKLLLQKLNDINDDETVSLDNFMTEEKTAELDSEVNFNDKIIAELIKNKLLIVEPDRKLMTITIKLQCDFNSLSEKQKDALKKYTETILKEWNIFKEKYKIPDNYLTIIKDKTGNIVLLKITLPTLAMYDIFIKQLANNLLRNNAPNNTLIKDKTDQKVTSTNNINKGKDETPTLFNPSPCSIIPIKK